MQVKEKKIITIGVIILIISTLCSSVFAGEVKWAGVRSSQYGATLNPTTAKINMEPTNWSSAHDQRYPGMAQWKAVTNAVANNFTSAKPTIIWIVGESDGSTGCTLSFNPGTATGSYISWESPYVPPYDVQMHDDYLQYFSDNGINVFLQVEPGHADVEELIDLVLNKYSHYEAVIGFGVDVEFYKYNPSNGSNARVSDATAQAWETKVKSYNSNYKLFLKHFFTTAMPPSYRGDIIFVDDIQDMGSKSNFLRSGGYGMLDFADAFAPNPVMFQIGYLADWFYSGTNSGYDVNTNKAPWCESTYGTDPQAIFDGLTNDLRNGTSSTQDIGFVWVDFSMRKLYPDAFNTFTGVKQTGNHYFKLNWYNAAAVTTVTMISPIHKELKTVTGYYPDTGSPIYLGWFDKDDDIILEIKSYWHSAWYGPVDTYDKSYVRATETANGWKFTFEDAVGYDMRYNDGEFEVYKQ